jgi:bacillolysin
LKKVKTNIWIYPFFVRPSYGINKYYKNTFNMTKLFTVVLVGFSMSGNLIAQSTTTNAQANGEKITMSTLSKFPSFIELAEGSNVPQTLFQDWIKSKLDMKKEDNLALYKTEAPDELGYTLYRYQQTYKGVPVLDGMYYSHVQNGNIKSANGEFFGDLNMSIAPTLTEDQALKAALQHIGASVYKWENKADEENMRQATENPSFSYYPKGSLAIAPLKGDHLSGIYKLCYMFDIYAEEPLKKVDIYIDAHTGEVVNEIDRIDYTDAVGTAVTRYSGTQSFTTDQVSTTSFRLRETGRGNGIQTYNCKKSTQSNTDFTDADNNWNNVNAAHDEVAADAHWGAEKVYDYYKNVHKRNSIDGNGFKLLSYVHYNSNYNNAFWDGSRMTYGDGDGTQFNPLTALDVCGHEITHGLVSNTSHFGSGEAGALNEGFADIFGTCIEFYSKPALANWLIGTDISPTATEIRSLQDPNAHKQPDTYKGTYWDPNGEVHKNDGVVNFWFYLLTKGGSGTNDIKNAYNITGITMAESEKIAFRGLTVYMTSSTGYSNARTSTIKAAEDLYGVCSPEAIATTNAWYAVGVGAKSPCANVGIESNFFDNSFEIYPNPSTSLITINKTAVDEKTMSVEVSNMVGEKLYSATIENKQGMFNKTIDVSTLSPGVYFVSLKNGNAVITRKLIKQ